MKRIKHYLYVPFVGLGLYGGYRGDRWFRNRIKIFKQFVIPSLQAQTNQNFTVWISFTRDQRGMDEIVALEGVLKAAGLKYIFTYSGICFYDDKHPIGEARAKLVENLHHTMPQLLDDLSEVDEIYMTIQPSDDCYHSGAVREIQTIIKDYEAVGYKFGYICNYFELKVSDYNPTTNPPFYTIKFDKETFIDPILHVDYTALKHDVPGYKAGTPLPSHEWVGDCLVYRKLDIRGFLVGCHSENISTYYDHPFKGLRLSDELRWNTIDSFGLMYAQPLFLKKSLRKEILRKLPFWLQKKLRYWWAEKIYNWLRR